MPTLQIRNVPVEIQQILKARAAAAGQSLSEYALSQLSQSAGRPTLADLFERIRLRGAVKTSSDPAEILRAERDAR